MDRKQPPFDLNEPVDIDVEFYDDGELADPVTANLRLVCPDHTVLNFALGSLTRLEQGKYRYTYLIVNGWGTYRGTWTTTGGVTVVRQFSFPVRRPDSG
jgi:hypothetical protein